MVAFLLQRHTCKSRKFSTKMLYKEQPDSNLPSLLNNYCEMGCDKERKSIYNTGTSLGGTIRINIDLGLGEMISPLDCIDIVFYSNYYQL